MEQSLNDLDFEANGMFEKLSVQKNIKQRNIAQGKIYIVKLLYKFEYD